jgi:hypothetical protein
MTSTPKKGEPYQLCTHLTVTRTGCHYWQVPGRQPWLVLCEACHASFSERKSVEIQGETFLLAEDIPIVPDSSCIHHSKPGDVIADDRPQPSQKAPKSPGQVLKFRSKEQEAQAWLAIGEQLASVVVRFAESFQKQWEARANTELRRMELEGQAIERMIRVLDSNAITIEGMQKVAMESQAAATETLKRLQSDVLALQSELLARTTSDSFLDQLDSVQRDLKKARRTGARRAPSRV